MSDLEIPNPSASRRQAAGICLVLAILTFAVFAQTLGHGFVNYDDDDYVVRNPAVTRGLTLPGAVWAFTSFHASNWHPLTWLSHMLDCEFYGLQAGGHHLTNVLLHTATVAVLFLVLWRMTGAIWRSAFVAAVFAIHPLRAESVAWVSERKDVLSGFFFTLTVGAYVAYVRQADRSKSEIRNPKGRANSSSNDPSTDSGIQSGVTSSSHALRFYVLVLVFFTLGLLCKAMLVTLPCVLLLLDFWPLQRVRGPALAEATAGRPWSAPKAFGGSLKSGAARPDPNLRTTDHGLWTLVWEKLPLLAISGLSCAVTLLAQSRVLKPFEAFPFQARILVALLSCRTYLVQMFYPVNLAAFYPYPRNLSVLRCALAALLLGAISTYAWSQRRVRPWLLTGWLWYLVMLAPVVGIVQVGDQAHADRYTYLPHIGLYLAATWLAADWLARRYITQAASGCLMAGVVGILMICAWNQTACWKNSETLWRHALACTTGNYLAALNLGHELFASGRLDEAIGVYQKALEANPGNARLHNNLGNALREKGKAAEALVEYEKAVRLNPAGAEAQFNLGKALSLQGRMEEAIDRFNEALRIDPDFLGARISLGNALLQQGKADRARVHFQRAAQLYPNDAGIRLNLGLCYSQTGKMEEAKLQYELALQMSSADSAIQSHFAWLLATCPMAALRNGSRAVELAQLANATSGGRDPMILRTLAAAYAEAGRFPEAVETAEQAARLAGENSNQDLVNQLQSELELYRSGKSFPVAGSRSK